VKKISIVMIFFIFVLELFFFSCGSSSKKTEELKKEPQITKLTKIKGRIQIDEIKYSGPPKESWIVAGIRDTVTNDLAKVREVEAISIDDQNKALQMIAERRKAGEKNLDPSKESAKILASDYLCVGNLQNTGKVLRLNIRLLKAPDFSAEQTATIDGTLDEIFTLQDKVVESLLANVDAKMKPEERLVIEVFTPRNKKAYELYAQGMEIRNKNPKKALELFLGALKLEPDYLHLMNSIGLQYKALSQYQESLNYHNMRMKVLEKKGLSKYEEYAGTLSNIGLVYQIQGKYDLAQETILKSLKIYEDLGLLKSQDYISTFHNMGSVYSSQGKYDLALEYYLKTSRIEEELGFSNTASYGTTLHSIGGMYYQKGKSDLALEYYFKSKKILDDLELSKTADYASSLNGIGAVYTKKGKYDLAIAFHMKSKKIEEDLGFFKTDGYAFTLAKIGIAYYGIGDFCQSAEWIQKAVIIQEQIGVPSERDNLEAAQEECNANKRKQ